MSEKETLTTMAVCGIAVSGVLLPNIKPRNIKTGKGLSYSIGIRETFRCFGGRGEGSRKLHSTHVRINMKYSQTLL